MLHEIFESDDSGCQNMYTINKNDLILSYVIYMSNLDCKVTPKIGSYI